MLTETFLLDKNNKKENDINTIYREGEVIVEEDQRR